MGKERDTIPRREFLAKAIPGLVGFLFFGCTKQEKKPSTDNFLSRTSTPTASKTPELSTLIPAPTQTAVVPTETPELTATVTETPRPTETPELKKEVSVEKVPVGETGKGNPIVAEYFSQTERPKGIILILGGTHPGENTGWLTDNQSQEGYLSKVKKWLAENKEEWEEFGVVLADINPDGEGRETPNRDDLGRNFGGEECSVCSWHKTDWRARKVTDPSGDSPMSSSEAKAAVNLAKIFQERNRILFTVFLHGEIPPRGLLDPAYCHDPGNPLSCSISEDIARRTKAEYAEILPYYNDSKYPSGLAGLPTDYFSVALNIASTCFEFQDKKPSDKNAAIFCQALFPAVRLNYSIGQ